VIGGLAILSECLQISGMNNDDYRILWFLWLPAVRADTMKSLENLLENLGHHHASCCELRLHFDKLGLHAEQQGVVQYIYLNTESTSNIQHSPF
jgi:hypothetical protein